MGVNKAVELQYPLTTPEFTMTGRERTKYRTLYLAKIGLDPKDINAWRAKWNSHCGRSITKGVRCDLTFSDYVKLAVKAGLTRPSQISTGIEDYHLARKGDIGPYSVGNCRFILNSANQQEKKRNGGAARGGMEASSTFILTSPSGESHTGRNLSLFAREHDLDNSKLAAVCRGERNIHRGWTGRYATRRNVADR